MQEASSPLFATDLLACVHVLAHPHDGVQNKHLDVCMSWPAPRPAVCESNGPPHLHVQHKPLQDGLGLLWHTKDVAEMLPQGHVICVRGKAVKHTLPHAQELLA
jgi:hypothetical protein